MNRFSHIYHCDTQKTMNMTFRALSSYRRYFKGKIGVRTYVRINDTVLVPWYAWKACIQKTFCGMITIGEISIPMDRINTIEMI